MAYKVTSSLQHVKNASGEYEIVLPITTVKEVVVNLESGKKLEQVHSEIQTKQEGLLDDLGNMMLLLAGLLDESFSLHQIIRENFKNEERYNITKGVFSPGVIKSDSTGLEFTLNEPIDVTLAPERIKLKHIININGTVSLRCQITVNAKDTNPNWFDASKILLNDTFMEIPSFEKEENVPYSINIRIIANCNAGGTIEISDLMVLHI